MGFCTLFWKRTLFQNVHFLLKVFCTSVCIKHKGIVLLLMYALSSTKCLMLTYNFVRFEIHIFVVFANSHPEIVITSITTNKDTTKMYNQVLSSTNNNWF